jgi:hypothetical protein
MEEFPLHRHYLHYSELPYSQRVLYTAVLLVLGSAYIFALLQINFTYAGRAGGNGKVASYQDIVVGYSGNKNGSVLETALRGPMAKMISSDDRQAIFAWLEDGSPREAYDKSIKTILDNDCMTCHDGSNPHRPNLSTYDDLKKMTAVDTGPTVATLVRVSHIHLFGLTFIFFIVGLMFSHAYVRPVWLKCVIVAAPFAAIIVDVSSWYIIRHFHPFAFVEILAGMTMAGCFAFMWLVTMYQMWFSEPPEAVTVRDIERGALLRDR